MPCSEDHDICPVDFCFLVSLENSSAWKEVFNVHNQLFNHKITSLLVCKGGPNWHMVWSLKRLEIRIHVQDSVGQVPEQPDPLDLVWIRSWARWPQHVTELYDSRITLLRSLPNWVLNTFKDWDSLSSLKVLHHLTTDSKNKKVLKSNHSLPCFNCCLLPLVFLLWEDSGSILRILLWGSSWQLQGFLHPFTLWSWKEQIPSACTHRISAPNFQPSWVSVDFFLWRPCISCTRESHTGHGPQLVISQRSDRWEGSCPWTCCSTLANPV